MPARCVPRGFTLIELLVVIAIIATLAAILFPVFAKAREKAFQTQCTNNQRQLATAIMIYAQDHEETLPAAKSWTGAIKLDSPDLFDCPTSTQEGDDYLYFGSVMANGTLEGMLSSQAIGDLALPSATPLLTDVKQVSAPYMDFGVKTYLSLKDLTAKYDLRHNGGHVVAWLDGHASYLKVGNLNRSYIMNTVTERDNYIFFQQIDPISTPSSAAPAGIEMSSAGYYGYKKIGLLDKVPTATDDFVLEFDINALGNVPYPYMLLGVGVPITIPETAAESSNAIGTYPIPTGYLVGCYFRTDSYWNQSRLRFYTNPPANLTSAGGGIDFIVNGGWGNFNHIVMSVVGTKRLLDIYKDPTCTVRLATTRANDFTPPTVTSGTQMALLVSKGEPNGNMTATVKNVLLARP